MLLRQMVFAMVSLLALQTQDASATTDTELLASCRGVLAETEPARRVWLEKDLFAYEMRAAVGASDTELRIYRENLADTCTLVAQNNDRRRMRYGAQVSAGRQQITRNNQRM